MPAPINVPHPGESYNPTLEDHQDLLRGEHERVAAEDEKFAKMSKAKERIMNNQFNPKSADTWESGYAEEVGSGEEDAGEEEESAADVPKKRPTKRKTIKQKAKRRSNILLEVGPALLRDIEFLQADPSAFYCRPLHTPKSACQKHRGRLLGHCRLWSTVSRSLRACRSRSCTSGKLHWRRELHHQGLLICARESLVFPSPASTICFRRNYPKHFGS